MNTLIHKFSINVIGLFSLAFILSGCAPTHPVASQSPTPVKPKDGTIASLHEPPISEQKPDIRVYDMFYWSHGIKVEAALSMPTKAGTYPLYVFCHGGYMEPLGYHLSKNDEVEQTVASPNDLNSPSGFVPANVVELYPAYQGYGESQGTVQDMKSNEEDVNNAIAALSDIHSFKRSGLYLDGASLGGGIVLMMATQRHDINAVVAECPLVGYDVFLNYINQIPDFPKNDIQDIKDYCGSDLNSTTYKALSPYDHIESIQAPVLLIQGKRDNVVPWQSVQAFANKMKTDHKNVQLILHPNDGHSTFFSREWYEEAHDFFAKYGLSDF